MTPLLATVLTAAAILTLVFLIGWVRLNPFITLFIVSVGLALVAGMPAEKAVASFEAGMGHVLGHVAGSWPLAPCWGRFWLKREALIRLRSPSPALQARGG